MSDEKDSTAKFLVGLYRAQRERIDELVKQIEEQRIEIERLKKLADAKN